MLELNSDSKEKIDFYIKIIPLLALLAIVLGYSFMSSYYDQFDIEIINYLDTTEILTTCFLTLFKFLTFPLSMTLIIIMGFRYLERYFNGLTAKRKLIFEAVAGILITIPFIFFKKIIFILGGHAGKELFYMIFYFFMLYLINKYAFSKMIGWEYRYMVMLVGSMCFLMFSHFGSSFYQRIYMSVPDDRGINRGEKNATFIHNDSTISSSGELIFIGQTRNYLFLHDIKRRENHIFPISEVKNLRIQTIHYKIDWGEVFYPSEKQKHKNGIYYKPRL